MNPLLCTHRQARAAPLFTRHQTRNHQALGSRESSRPRKTVWVLDIRNARRDYLGSLTKEHKKAPQRLLPIGLVRAALASCTRLLSEGMIPGLYLFSLFRWSVNAGHCAAVENGAPSDSAVLREQMSTSQAFDMRNKMHYNLETRKSMRWGLREVKG